MGALDTLLQKTSTKTASSSSGLKVSSGGSALGSLLSSNKGRITVAAPKKVSTQKSTITPAPKIGKQVQLTPAPKLTPIAQFQQRIVEGINKLPILHAQDITLKSPIPENKMLSQAKKETKKRQIIQMAGELSAGFLNTPQTSAQSATSLGTRIGHKTTTPQQIAGDLAGMAQLPLLFLGGGAEGTAAKETIGAVVAKQGIKKIGTTVVKNIAKTTAEGGAFGLVSGIQSGKNITNVHDYISNLIENTKFGAEFGLGSGTVFHVALPLAKGASSQAGAVFVKLVDKKPTVEAIQMHPKVVQDTVMQGNLENMPLGKELLKESVVAAKNDQHVMVIPDKEGEFRLPTGEKVDVVTNEPYVPKSEKYNTPEIIKAREEQAKVAQTHLINTPERDKMRSDITEYLYKNGGYADPAKRPTTEIKSNRRADIVMGMPGSGKSTAIADPLVKEHGSVLIDSDEAKMHIPESQGGSYNGAVHGESTIIHNALLEKAIEKDNNIVLPVVGKNIDRIRATRDKLTALDYEVHLHYSDVRPETAVERAIKRHQETGKFVDPEYILNEVGLRPSQNYDILKQERGFASYEKYSNEVPAGEKPKLIERGTSRSTDAARRSPGGSNEQNAGQTNPEAKGNTANNLNSSQEPVGTGKLKESRAYKRLVEHIQETDPATYEKIKDDPKLLYNTVNQKYDFENAAKIVEQDPEKAYRIAKRFEEAPANQRWESVNIVLADRALAEKNYALWKDLEQSRSLAQTRAGQGIVAERGRFDQNSPHYFVQQVLDERLARLGRGITDTIDMTKEQAKSIKEKAVAKIDQQVERAIKFTKKQKRAIDFGQKFLDEITCK